MAAATSRQRAGRITVATDGRRNPARASGFELVVARGRAKPVGIDCVEWARRCEALGAGVLLPTRMDGDGSQAGWDIPFPRAIAEAAKLPSGAFGGDGTLERFHEAAGWGLAVAGE